jgi:regulator of chromosome condensation
VAQFRAKIRSPFSSNIICFVSIIIFKMPYNLRKRKLAAPEAPEAPEAREPAKVPKKRTKKEEPKAAKVEQNEAVKKRAKKEEPKEEQNEVSKKRVKKEELKDAKEEQNDASKKRVKTEEPKDQTNEQNQLVFGDDTCGELGLKKIGISKREPTRVPINVIKQVACGPMHTLSLDQSGKIYSYGCNDEGALGRITNGDETLEATPTAIELDGEVVKISAGDSHGAALTSTNQVFIWGNFRDEHGSVGLLPECDGQATYKPIQVMPEKKFKDIASGSNHMLLLDVDGVVYSFGVGAQGQLGRLSPEQVGQNEKTVSISADNRDLFLKPDVVPMKQVDPQREFICDAIYAGNFSSFATNTDKKKNRLAAWGLNNYFQLGYKGQQKGQLIQYYPRRSTFTCSTSMINVACGQHHTIFLTKTGRVYAAGRNEYGMLGIGNSMKDKKEVCPAKQIDTFDGPITDISAGINTSFAVSADGKLYAWGMNGRNLGVESGDDDLMEPTEVKSLAAYKVISVSSGSSFTAVIVGN